MRARFRHILLLLCTAFICDAQNRIMVSIQANKKSYPEKDFFFYKVADARTNKENIGMIYKTNRSAMHEAVFRNSLEKELYLFLADVFPNDKSRNRIFIVVREFEIGHILDIKDTGYAILNLDFYRFKGDSVSFISNYRKIISESAEDVFLTHANRMKRAILYAVTDLESHLNEPVKYAFEHVAMLSDPNYKKRDLPAQKEATASLNRTAETVSVQALSSVYSKSSYTKQDSLEGKYPTRFVALLGVHWNPCTSSSAIGVNVDFLFRLPRHYRWLLGANINYDWIRFYDRNGIPDNQSYELKASNLGFRTMKQVREIVFFNLNPHLLIGKETIGEYRPQRTYNSSTNSYSSQYVLNETVSNFFGFQLDLGLYLMSLKRGTAFCGLDLCARLTNSFVFDNDVGAKLNVGIKF